MVSYSTSDFKVGLKILIDDGNEKEESGDDGDKKEESGDVEDKKEESGDVEEGGEGRVEEDGNPSEISSFLDGIK